MVVLLIRQGGRCFESLFSQNRLWDIFSWRNALSVIFLRETQFSKLAILFCSWKIRWKCSQARFHK